MEKNKPLIITMRDLIGIVVAVLAGLLIAYFGVFGSLSAVVEAQQRFNVMGSIALVYFAVGAMLGLVFPNYSWKWGILLSAPGALFLGSLLRKEFNSFLLLYLAVIVFFACIGTWDGKLLRNRRRKEQSAKETPKGRSKRQRTRKEPDQSGAEPERKQKQKTQLTTGRSRKARRKKK